MDTKILEQLEEYFSEEFALVRRALAKRQSDHRNRLFPNTTFIIHYDLH